MRILLSYSKAHFDPDKSKAKYSESGTGFLAKTFYESLSSNSKVESVDYLDFSEYRSVPKGEKYDFFFGLSPNFRSFADRVTSKNRILFSVNRNNKFRYATVAQIASKGGSSWGRLSSEDGIYSDPSDYEYATKILQLGGWSNFLANRMAGVSDFDQYLVSFSRGGLAGGGRGTKKRDQILFFAGSISERKGLYALEAICAVLKGSHPNVKLHLVGRAVNGEVHDYLSWLSLAFPNEVIWTSDFLVQDGPDWFQMFDRAIFAISPSLEEGQQDAVSQAVKLGVPVLMSAECGFETFLPETLVVTDSASDWAKAVDMWLISPDIRHQNLKLQQALESMRAPAALNVTKAIDRLIESHGRNVWPSIHFAVKSARESWLYPNLSLDSTSAEYSLTDANPTGNVVQTSLSGGRFKPRTMDPLLQGVLMLDRYPKLIRMAVTPPDGSSGQYYLATSSDTFGNVVSQSPPLILRSSVGSWVDFSDAKAINTVRLRIKFRRYLAMASNALRKIWAS